MQKPFFTLFLTASAILLTGCTQTPAKPASQASSSSQSSSLADAVSSQAPRSLPAKESSSASSKSSSSQSEAAYTTSFEKAKDLAQRLSELYQKEGCQTDTIQINDDSDGMDGSPAVSFTATQAEENNPPETAAVQIWITNNPQADLETMSTKLENDGEMRVMSEWSDENTDVRIIRNNRSNLNFLLFLDQSDSLLVQIEDSAPEILPATVSVIRNLGFPLNDSFN